MKRSVRSPVLAALATTPVVTSTAALNQPDTTAPHSTPLNGAGGNR
ncbi:hypothetical protein [Streptomyces tendae]